MPFWGSSLRPNLLPLVVVVHWFFILVYQVRFFFFQVRFLSLFQHLLVFGCVVCWFLISVFFFFREFATIYNLLGLFYLVFFFRWGLLYHLLFRIDVGLFFPGELALLQLFIFFCFLFLDFSSNLGFFFFFCLKVEQINFFIFYLRVFLIFF